MDSDIDCVVGKLNKEDISKVGDLIRRSPEGSFSIATTPSCKDGASPFPGLLHFTLDSYLIMLIVK